MAAILLTAAGREIPLRFDGQAWLDIEEHFGSLGEMNRRMAESEKPMQAAMELAAIVSAGGARKYGGEAVTAAWLTENLTPREMNAAAALAKAAVTRGLTRRKAQDEDVDEVAEELAKNAESCSTEER